MGACTFAAAAAAGMKHQREDKQWKHKNKTKCREKYYAKTDQTFNRVFQVRRSGDGSYMLSFTVDNNILIIFSIAFKNEQRRHRMSFFVWFCISIFFSCSVFLSDSSKWKLRIKKKSIFPPICICICLWYVRVCVCVRPLQNEIQISKTRSLTYCTRKSRMKKINRTYSFCFVWCRGCHIIVWILITRTYQPLDGNRHNNILNPTLSATHTLKCIDEPLQFKVWQNI